MFKRQKAAGKRKVGTGDEASLLSLPPEVILDDILPRLPLKDLYNVSATCKLLRGLCKDPSLWRIKTENDFSSFGKQLALGHGKDEAGWYERVYLGLRHPRAFIWGDKGQGRLGTDESIGPRLGFNPYEHVKEVDRPMAVSDWFNSVSVVDIQAAGWSFAARDSNGGVWVWGQLDGTSWNYSTDSKWSEPDAIVPQATKIPLPCKAVEISTGRRHLVLLDSDNLIWEMKAWGRAYHHTAPEFTAPSQTGAKAPGRGPFVVQVEAGWEFTACLTAEGSIHTWKPFTPLYTESCTPKNNLHGPLKNRNKKSENSLKWGTVGAEVVNTLSPIPERPQPPSHDKAAIEAEERFAEAEKDLSLKEKEEAQRVVKIACGNSEVLALKANGEVWVGAYKEEWQYLVHFSFPSITHISAQWVNFFTYATPTPTDPRSQVYAGRCENFDDGIGWYLKPVPIPELDNLHIIRVVAGDWHYAALTVDGQMYTWGQNGRGQCGQPLNVNPDHWDEDEGVIPRPKRVYFSPHRKDDEDSIAFVYAIAAAGMHTGALVLGTPGIKELAPRNAYQGSAPEEDYDDIDSTPTEFTFPGRNLWRGRGLRFGFPLRGMLRSGQAARGRGPPDTSGGGN